MQTVFPTPNEYQSDPRAMADWIFSTSLLSKESQTAVFFGSISSLDAVMKRNINNSTALAREAVDMYKKLFERYFDEAEVNYNIENDPKVGNADILYLDIRFRKDQTWYTFSESVIYLNGLTRKVSEVING